MKTQLINIKQDITTLRVDAIVNAANVTLLGGGGIDGAIHRTAGPGLLEECKMLDGCEKGESKITKGYNLPVKYIIHTVGPIFGLERGKENELLRNCYWNSLLLAKEYNVKSIAFPAISTGIYRFPKDEAAKISIETVRNFLFKEEHQIEKVYFVSFSDLDLKVYENILNNKEVTIENIIN